MPFIVAVLTISVFLGVNAVETATMVPKNYANLTSTDPNIFGSISLHLRATAFKNSLPPDQQSCEQISLVDSESPLVDCTNSAVVTNEASKELADTMLLCSVHLTCTVSNKVTGRPNVKFSFPKSFQAIQWVIKPDKSWNYQQTQVTHTLRATNGVLSGTKATPSMVNIQLLRGKYDDLRVEAENKTNGIRTDYGLQLAWAGSKLVEPEDGGGGEEDVHYVSFQFDVNPLVLKITAKNIKDQLSLAITVMTLFLSVIAFVKSVKIVCEYVIDKFLLRRGASAPDDVQMRQSVLGEIKNFAENDIMSPAQQEEKMGLGEEDADIPTRKMHSNPMGSLERGTTLNGIEMNDTGLTNSKGNEIEIMLNVEKMLNNMREEMRKEIDLLRQEHREEMDVLKSQISQQQEGNSVLKAAKGTSVDDTIAVHTDPNTGRRYSVNPTTKVSEWLKN